MCFDLCALCNWVCCIKNKKKKKESKNRSQIKSGCFLFFLSLHRNIPHADSWAAFVTEDRVGNTSRLYHLLSVSWTIRSSDGICVSIKPYLKIFCLFKNSLNSPNALSDCSVITLGRAEMAELESYLLPSFPLRTDWKPCSGALAWSPVKTAF